MLCEDESRSPSIVSLPLMKSSAVRYIPLVVAFLSAAPSGIATTTAKISVVIRNVYRIGVLLSLRRANSIHPGQHAAFRSCNHENTENCGLSIVRLNVRSLKKSAQQDTLSAGLCWFLVFVSKRQHAYWIHAGDCTARVLARGQSGVICDRRQSFMDVKRPVIADGETQGLSDSVAAERLEKEGPNELPAAKPKSALAIAVEVVSEPMFLLLIATGTVYLVLGSVEEAAALGVSIFVIIGITLYQQTKTERTLQALRDLSSPRALVIRGGHKKRIAGREVVRGDILVLSEGDRVPADALVLSSVNF